MIGGVGMAKKSVQRALVVFSILCILCIELTYIDMTHHEYNGLIDNVDTERNVCQMSGCIDITVEEAWYLISNTSNGIQIPIDVRTDEEWENDFIDSAPPEYPRHHNVYEWENISILDSFIEQYNQKELILYCKSGGRSKYAAQLLTQNGFNGTLYNMLGGIIAWKTKGFPVRNNTKPEAPTIIGPSRGKIKTDIEFSVVTTDLENDNVNYIINWSMEHEKLCLGPYNPQDEIYISYNWSETGRYTVDICARDIYGKESECATLKIRIDYDTDNVYAELIAKIFNLLVDIVYQQMIH